jgi:hypothetical protein
MRPRLVLGLFLAIAHLQPASAQFQALSLVNGTNGYVAVPHSPSLAPAQITVEAWVYFLPTNLAPAGTYPTVIRKNVLAAQEVYFLRVQQSTGRVAWKVRLPGGASVTATSPAALPTNTWTHLAGTFDGTTCRLYFNGVQVAQAAGTGALTDNGGALRIGKGDDATVGGETWNGYIEELRLWSVARTASQILGTMNWQLDVLPNLVSAWHFDGNALEPTGGNHGTEVGNYAYVPSGVPLFTGPPPYQVNSPAASLSLDGIQGEGFSPGVRTVSFTPCAPGMTTASFASTNTGQPWDLAYTAGRAVPANAGGFMTAGGQAVNINLADPTLGFLNGLAFVLPFSNLSVPLSVGSALDLAAQMLVISPASPDGAALSQAVELHAALGATSVPGPTGDDTAVAVQLSNPAFCGAPTTLPFFGTSYGQFDVISNGRVMFGAPSFNTTFTPTVAGAMTASYPFVGLWCDLNPATGGVISISTPSPLVVRVHYAAVNYFATTIPTTFAIQFDGLSGTVSLESLTTVAAHTANQFLGISPGVLGPATDPGQTAFAPGGPNFMANPTDMIYRFGPAGSLTPGVTRIEFLPLGNGYAWIGT